jgi:hypothetical protein
MSNTLKPAPSTDTFAERLQKAMQRHRPEAPDTTEAPRSNPTVPPASSAPDLGGGPCTDDDPTCVPVGQGEYVIKDNDCLSSIAKETGRLWETIWNDEANAGLREARKDPNVLLTGDRLTIPPLRQRAEPGQTEMRHRFVRIGQPTVFQLRLAHNGKPLAQRPYTMKYDNGEEFKSATNSDGFLRCPMPSDADTGHLTLLAGQDEEAQPQREYKLNFGKLQPIESLTGVQQRLRNLGFYEGPNTHELDERTHKALKSYQADRDGLAATGKPDSATRARLKEEHGS